MEKMMSKGLAPSRELKHESLGVFIVKLVNRFFKTRK